MTRSFAVALLATTVPLSACTVEDTADQAEAQGEDLTNSTLASELAALDGFTFLESTLDDTGLSTAFDGAAAYTVLAPSDAALTAASADAELLSQPQNRAIAVAMVRDHVLPGALTPDDIRTAVEKSDGADVAMTTLGDSIITFSLDGDNLIASVEDGEPVIMPAGWTRASNGVVIPIDGILGTIPTLQAAALES